MEPQKATRLPTGQFTKWNETEIADYLKEKELSDDVANLFIKHKVTGQKVFELYHRDQEKLKRIGIINKSDIQLCLKVFNELQRSLALQRSKIFQDPIHGSIELHPLLVKIIDTPQFQRLRDIKQLGGVYYVYPGASHNRFEHSIGVCYLAGEFVNKLRECQPELNIDDHDVLCVKIAALCHDLGHGPFSHLYQDLFIKEMCRGRQWKTEEASLQMLQYMLEVNEKLPDQFEEYGISWDSDKNFIMELITGEPLDKSQGFSSPSCKHFLYEIVSNKLYGVDVDKMDYIARDCHGLGIKSSFDARRYMEFCRVIEADDGKMHICLRDKEDNAVNKLFAERSHLFKVAYQHKTKRSIEKMICEALMLVDEYLVIPGAEGKPRKLSTAIDDMCAFTKLNDSVIQAIMFYPCNDASDQKCLKAFEEAQSLITCVQKRNIYSLLSVEIVEPQSESQHEDDEGIEDDVSDENKWKDKVKFEKGYKNENPVDRCWFYKKDLCGRAERKKRTNHQMSDKYTETEIRIYRTNINQDGHQSLKHFPTNKESSKPTKQISFLPPTSAKDVDDTPKQISFKSESRPMSLHTVVHLLIVAMSVALIYFSFAEHLDSKHLPGVTILQTKKFVVTGGRMKNFNWEEYGIQVSVPSDALPNELVSTLTVHVSVSGPYVFPNPEKWKISSAVYWISSTKNFLRPVMIKIRHTSVYNDSKVRFLRSTGENINGTFKFTEEPGGYFSTSDSYGYMFLDHFSGFAISSDMDTDEQFYGWLFWKKMSKMSWSYSFLIHRQIAKGISRDLLKTMYNGWNHLPETSVVFENDEVELVLENKDKSTWNLAAVYDPLKYSRKQLLQSMEITSNMQFTVWQKYLGAEPLIISLPFTGTKQPKHITLSVDPGEQNRRPFFTKIEDEHQLTKWAYKIDSALEYCNCLEIDTTICRHIKSDNHGKIKDQAFEVTHTWYNSGERTWEEFASAFECMDKLKIAREIREEHINMQYSNTD